MSGLQLLCYFSIIVMVIGVIYRAIKISRMPLHLRWDLYPIPHEKGKEHYGGSYFEEVDWWTKKPKFSLMSEIKEMGKEIFFIQSLYRNNRTLWAFSMPFHLGLYILILFFVLLVGGALLEIAGMNIVSTSTDFIPRYLSVFTQRADIYGSILGAIGALGLLLSRIFKKELRSFSVRSDYFNLLLLLAIFINSFVVLLTIDRDCSIQRAFVGQLITFGPIPPVPTAMAIQMILTSIFFLYLPFTHMTHFVGKYFTYHKVRWEDHPNIRGGKIEEAVSKALGYKLNWSAPHIKAGATWAESATDVNADKGKEKK